MGGNRMGQRVKLNSEACATEDSAGPISRAIWPLRVVSKWGWNNVSHWIRTAFREGHKLGRGLSLWPKRILGERCSWMLLATHVPIGWENEYLNPEGGAWSPYHSILYTQRVILANTRWWMVISISCCWSQVGIHWIWPQGARWRWWNKFIQGSNEGEFNTGKKD